MTTNNAAASPSRSGHLFIIYGLVVLYALCYQLQIPLEPFLVDKLLSDSNNNGGDETVAVSESEAATTYGRFKSYFSMTQSVGSLAFGFILDRWGVRVGLVVNFLACAMCYYILSITNTVHLLYLSRLPGVFMAGFLAAQTAVIKLTKVGPDRLKALGRLTSAYTVGGIVGPALGGQLGSSGDYFIGAKLATAGSLVAAVLVCFLPASIDDSVHHHESSVDNENDEQQQKEHLLDEGNEGNKKDHSSTTWLQRVLTILQLVWIYLFVKIITSIANSMAKSAQPLILKRLGIDEAQMGMVMSAQFAFGGFANAFLLGPVTKIMGGVVSLVVGRCIMIMGLAYCLQAFLYSGETNISHLQYPFVTMIMLLSIFQYSLGTSITTKTSSIVPKHMQGTLMGLEHALFAVAYMAGPQLGVAGLQSGGIGGLSAMCAAIFGAVFVVWTFFSNKISAEEVGDKSKSG